MSEHLDQISYDIIGHLKKNFNNIKDLQFTGMGVGRNIIKKYAEKVSELYKSGGCSKLFNIDAVNNLSTNTPSFLLTLLLKKFMNKKTKKFMIIIKTLDIFSFLKGMIGQFYCAVIIILFKIKI